VFRDKYSKHWPLFDISSVLYVAKTAKMAIIIIITDDIG